MALTKGTNCGFVSSSPVDDPVSGGVVAIDSKSMAIKDVAPSNTTIVNEIGWWCDNATEESNFEVGIYCHDSSNDRPNIIVGVSRTNAKGTTAGWKKVTGLSIPITGGQTYWIAIQLDDVATATNIDRLSAALEGSRYSYIGTQTTLTDPWSSGSAELQRLIAIYAVYETGTQPPIQRISMSRRLYRK